jgi:hypothetical protein
MNKDHLQTLARDLRKTLPRSLRETLGGFVIAARMLDKMGDKKPCRSAVSPDSRSWAATPTRPFAAGAIFSKLTWQARKGERGGESGSKKEMSHSRWRLTGSYVFNKGQSFLSIVRRK